MEQARRETDSMGTVEVDAERYWGAQTQRSLLNFDIGRPRFVWEAPVVRAFGVLKKAAARANAALGELPADIATAIAAAADEIVAGCHDKEFPLVVFQTGSGTHTNMNANEVIANRANEMLGQPRGSKSPVHPNDHVNRGQSSNDTFPAAMHIATLQVLHAQLLPSLAQLRATLRDKAALYQDVVKTGRTHLQDATPITLGQEIGAWVAQLDHAHEQLLSCEDGLLELALGATAVGTGLNAHPRFGEYAAAEVAALTGLPFRPARNAFAALSAHEAMLQLSAALRTLATALFKLANDVRWLASGPRCGIGELRIPENEPGSSIMPGKVNPSQCEALTMVCTQVIGNDAAVAFAASQGNFQLNVFKPVILHNVLESLRLLGDGCLSFERHCALGIEPDRQTIDRHLQDNLMLVTALNRHIGYDKAAQIAKLAHEQELSLREAALRLGHVSAEEYDAWVRPIDMTHP